MQADRNRRIGGRADVPRLIHRTYGTAKATKGRGILASASEILPARAAEILDDLTAIVARACAKINELSQEELLPRMKVDHSPVTAADEASEALIVEGIGRLLPGIPVVSEESADQNRGRLDGSFLIVDPLDGTREFLAGRDEFTVNLAIVTHGVPVAGIIAAPKQAQLWRGVVGHGAERLRLSDSGAGRADAIHTRPWPNGPIAAVSR